MAIRNGAQGLNEFAPLTTLVEREENMLERMGLFSKDFSDQKVVEFERVYGGTDDMYSVARGADRQYAGDDEAKTAYVEIPFFTLDKIYKASDAQFLRKWLTETDNVTLDDKVTEIMARIQRGHARLHKKVMYACLKGSTYAVDKAGNPRPNLTRTYQSIFDISNAEMFNGTAGGTATVNLADQTVNPADVFEDFRKHVIAKAGDQGDNYRIVALLGSEAFTLLKNHSDYVEAFANFASSVEPLRNRLGGLSNNRVLEWQGITYVEDISGELATDSITLFPLGFEGEMFQLRYGPDDTLAAVNGDEPVAESYIYVDQDRRKATVESSTSLLCVNSKPELVARYTHTTA